MDDPGSVRICFCTKISINCFTVSFPSTAPTMTHYPSAWCTSIKLLCVVMQCPGGPALSDESVRGEKWLRTHSHLIMFMQGGPVNAVGTVKMLMVP